MKAKLIKKKKNKHIGVILLTLTAIGGICTIAATQLKRKRQRISAKANTPHMHTGATPSGGTVASGCQKVGQNESIPGKTDIDCSSPEWERGVS